MTIGPASLGSILILVHFITLHAPDGGKVEINPDAVTSLRARKTDGSDSGLFTKNSQCLINFSDGKSMTVIETCETVHHLLEKAEK